MRTFKGGKREALQLEASIHAGVTCFVNADGEGTTWATMGVMHGDIWALKLCSTQTRFRLG